MYFLSKIDPDQFCSNVYCHHRFVLADVCGARFTFLACFTCETNVVFALGSFPENRLFRWLYETLHQIHRENCVITYEYLPFIFWYNNSFVFDDIISIDTCVMFLGNQRKVCSCPQRQTYYSVIHTGLCQWVLVDQDLDQ